MRWAIVVVTLCPLVLGTAVPGWAQDAQTRPATTTFLGDTGLWFVPSGEVLPGGAVSFSAYRTEFDFRQGNTSVSAWPLTGAVGIGRTEVFGSLHVVTRIDRDTVPLLFAGPEDEAGGLLNQHPNVHESWIGNQIGDLFLGGKVNMLSQQSGGPLALAFRGTVKLPTGDSETGAGSGEWDWFGDLVASAEAGGVEYSGFGGVVVRGDPGDIKLSDGIRWGGGAAFPARRTLRATAEVSGEWMIENSLTAPPGLIVGEDGSLSPATSRLEDTINAAIGLTWQHSSGLLLGAAFNYRFDLETESASGVPPSTSGDAMGFHVRIGFHRGVKAYAPPPPAVALAPEPAPAPPAASVPAAPASAANAAPTVRARCEPCTVEAGLTATLRAEASDPDGDRLSFQWSASGGTIADTRGEATEWRAETAPGLITFTVTVDDGRGGTATDTVTIDVATGETVRFEHVLFDFDSSVLKQEALPILEPVIVALNQKADMQIEVEGHTCNIGTTEYNLALGDRRADAVRQYLIGRGIAAERITTVTYGEERPAHDNTQETTRRLNRRAVLVVHSIDDGTTDSSR
jgi:outer membrane protein OmpA-like peptidoglycan-associated protein